MVPPPRPWEQGADARVQGRHDQDLQGIRVVHNDPGDSDVADVFPQGITAGNQGREEPTARTVDHVFRALPHHLVLRVPGLALRHHLIGVQIQDLDGLILHPAPHGHASPVEPGVKCQGHLGALTHEDILDVVHGAVVVVDVVELELEVTLDAQVLAAEERVGSQEELVQIRGEDRLQEYSVLVVQTVVEGRDRQKLVVHLQTLRVTLDLLEPRTYGCTQI